MRSSSRRASRSAPEAVVPIVGLSWFAIFASFLVVRGAAGGYLATYQLFFIPLATACALSAIGIWHRPTVGYIGGAAISVALVLIFFLTKDGNDVMTVLSAGPGRNYVQFIFYLTTVPTFFTTILFSVLGVLKSRRL